MGDKAIAWSSIIIAGIVLLAVGAVVVVIVAYQSDSNESDCLALANSLSIVDSRYSCYDSAGGQSALSLLFKNDISAFQLTFTGSDGQKQVEIAKDSSYSDLRGLNGEFDSAISYSSDNIETFVYSGSAASSVEISPIVNGYVCGTADSRTLVPCDSETLDSINLGQKKNTTDFHLTCINNACTKVAGVGTSTCTVENTFCGTRGGGGGGGGGGNNNNGGNGGNKIPVAYFEANVTNGTAPLNVLFNATLSSDPDGTIVSYAWDFGDNTTVLTTNKTIEHTFFNSSVVPSLYNVFLTVTDNAGAKDSENATITVDLDTDGDGVIDGSDNCPADFNPLQEDFDGDGFGDVCDVQTCGDGSIESPGFGLGWDNDEVCDDGNILNGDGCSNVCELETFSITIDSPVDGSTYNVLDLPLNLVIEDSANVKYQCVYYLDSLPEASIPACQNTTITVTEGSHTLIVAMNAATNWSRIVSDSVSFGVNEGAPSVTIDSPDDGAYTNADPITFSYKPSDTNLVSCSLLGDFSGTYGVVQTDNASVSDIVNSFSVSSIPEGTFNWAISCTDDTADVSTTSNRTLNVDRTAPVISNPSTNPISGSTYSFTQTYTFSSSVSGNPESVWMNFNGKDYMASLVSGSYQITLPTLAANVGGYGYQWFANDTAGNAASSGVLSYVVNKAVPQGTLSNSGLWTVIYGSSVTIGYSESNFGDADVDYSVNRDGVLRPDSELVNLGAGTYNYVLSTAGGQNYTNNLSMNARQFVVDRASSTTSLSFNGLDSPQVYGTPITASCTDTNPEASPILYRNGVDVTSSENNVPVVLGAGVYTYGCIVATTQNYTGASTSSNYTISQQVGDVDASIDGVRSSKSVRVNVPVTLGAVLVNGQGQIQLEFNNTIINSGNSPLSNITSLANAGTYTVRAIYSGNQNYTSDSESWILTVTPNNPPTASFTATPQSGQAPLNVGFDASASSDSDGTIVSYQWDFENDGVVDSSGVTTNHVYSVDGTYVANLTVTDNDGAKASTTSTIIVSPGNTPPTYSNLNVNPASPTTYSYTQTYTFSSTWTDDSAVSSVILNFNGKNYTSTNTGNVYSVSFPPLGANNTGYSYYWIATDNQGAVTTTPASSYVIFGAIPLGTLTSSAGWTLTYPTPSDFSFTEPNQGDGDVIYFIDRSGAGQRPIPENNVLLGAGSYLYDLYVVNPSQNYSTGLLDERTLDITKGTPTLSFTSSSTLNYTYGVLTNLTGSGCPTQGAGDVICRFYIDGVAQIPGNTISNLALGAGTHVVTYNATGGLNWTIAGFKNNIDVNKNTAVLTLDIQPSTTVPFPTETTATGGNCPSELSGTCGLTRNGASVSNPPNVDIQTLAAGTYVYNYSTVGNANYNPSSVSQTLTVTQDVSAPSITNVNVNPSSPQFYNPSRTYTFSADCVDNVAVANVNLWLDSSVYPAANIGGNTYAVTFSTLGANSYDYQFECIDTSSNGATSTLATYVINQNVTSCSLNVNSATYPNTVTATASCNNPESAMKLYRNNVDVTSNNGQAVLLGAGSYTFIANVTSSQNYTGATASQAINVAKGTATLGLTNSRGSSYAYGLSATLTGSNCPALGAGDLSCNLYLDNVIRTNPYSGVFSAGLHTAAYNTTGGSNWTNSQTVVPFTVTQQVGDVAAYINGARSGTIIAAGTSIPLNATILNGNGNVQLELQGVVIASGATSVQVNQNFASAGSYNVTARYFGNTNYTGDSETWFVTVNSGASNPSISFVSPTPADGANVGGNSVVVNISSSDSDGLYTFLDFNKTLVMWMRMDDVDGSGNPLDLSGYNNNGVKTGNAAQVAGGKFGSAFTFDGANDYISVSDSASLGKMQAQNALTFSVWIKPTALGYYGIMGDDRTKLLMNGGNLEFYLYTGTLQQIVANAGLVAGQWQLVTATYDKTSGQVSVYRNGVLVGSNTVANANLDGTTYLAIGDTAGWGDWFSGQIDEAMVFSRALSQAEVLSLYDATVNQYFNTITGLANPATYVYQGHAVDTLGNRASTSQRTVNLQALPQCSDSVDNDGDGAVDGADFACQQGGPNENSFTAQCQNGINDDIDGWVDLADPGCADNQDNSEVNGNTGFACSNNLDDDGDSLIDGFDSGCSNAQDNDERNTPTLDITILPSTSVTVGTQTTATGTGCPSGVTCTLRRNGATVSNPPNVDIQTLAQGIYVYNYSTTGNSQWAPTSKTATLNVGVGASLNPVIELNEAQWMVTARQGGGYSQTKVDDSFAPLPVFFEGWKSSPRDQVVRYEWDFGDGSPTAPGFNQAHVYETPGTYTATLRVYDSQGNFASTTKQINVKAPLRTFYVDAVNGNDANNGLSEGSAWKTAAKGFGLLTSGSQPGDRVLFKRGQTFNTNFISVSHNVYGISFGAYGTGARPVLLYNGSGGGGGYFLNLEGYNGLAYISFSDLTFNGNDYPSGSVLNKLQFTYNFQDFQNILFNRDNFFGFGKGITWNTGAAWSGGAPDTGNNAKGASGYFLMDSNMFNTTIQRSDGQTHGTMTACQHVSRCAVIGNHLDLSNNHINYDQGVRSAVVYDNIFTRPADGRQAYRLIGGGAQLPSTSTNSYIGYNFMGGWIDNRAQTAYQCGVSGAEQCNRFPYEMAGLDAVAAGEDGPNLIENIIFENNIVTDAEVQFNFGSIENVTARNNLFRTQDRYGVPRVLLERAGCTGCPLGSQVSPIIGANITNNTFISDSSTGVFDYNTFSGSPPTYKSTNHEKISIEGNTFYDLGSSQFFSSDNSFSSTTLRNNVSLKNNIIYSNNNNLFDLNGALYSASTYPYQSMITGTTVSAKQTVALEGLVKSQVYQYGLSNIPLEYKYVKDYTGSGVKFVHLWVKKDNGAWTDSGLTNVATSETKGSNTYLKGTFSYPVSTPGSYYFATQVELNNGARYPSGAPRLPHTRTVVEDSTSGGGGGGTAQNLCGNGVLETYAGEQCDDGNNENGDGCSSTCQVEGGSEQPQGTDGSASASGSVGLSPAKGSFLAKLISFFRTSSTPEEESNNELVPLVGRAIDDSYSHNYSAVRVFWALLALFIVAFVIYVLRSRDYAKKSNSKFKSRRR